MNMNAAIDKFLKRTLWLWLPFYALFDLIKDASEKFGKK